MAVRFCPGDSCRGRLAQPEKLASAAKLFVAWLFTDRVACPFVGLLPLPDFFPTCSVHFCGCSGGGCCGGMDRFFAERPVPFNTNTLCESSLEKRISSCQQRRLRWPGE